MPKKPSALRPSQVFAGRMRYLRERRRWSQQDLADRLAEMGNPTDRATIARTETLTRGLSLDDAVLYAAALGGSLTHMVATPAPPLSDETPIAIGPKFVVPPVRVRRWVRGQASLREEDRQTFTEEVSDDERAVREDTYLAVIAARSQHFIDAMLAGDDEAAADYADELIFVLERKRRDLQPKGEILPRPTKES